MGRAASSSGPSRRGLAGACLCATGRWYAPPRSSYLFVRHHDRLFPCHEPACRVEERVHRSVRRATSPLAGLGSGTRPGPGPRDGGHPTGHRTGVIVAHVVEPLDHVLLGSERSEERTPQPSQLYLLAAPTSPGLLPRGRGSTKVCAGAGAQMEEPDGRGAPRAGRHVSEVVLGARSINKTCIASPDTTSETPQCRELEDA